MTAVKALFAAGFDALADRPGQRAMTQRLIVEHESLNRTGRTDDEMPALVGTTCDAAKRERSVETMPCRPQDESDFIFIIVEMSISAIL